MTTRFRLLICAVTLSLFSFQSRASADLDDRYDDRDGVRLYGGLWLGFGGNIDIDAEGPFGIDVGGKDDLVTTVGGQVGFDIPVIRYLSLGGEARLGTFNSEGLDDAGVDRSKLLDLVFKPRLRFPIGRSPLELYGTLPIGLTVPFLADDFGDDDNVDAKVGWNLGVGAGLNYWVTNRLALNFEPMWLMHWYELEPRVGSADVSMGQFTMFFNVVAAL